MEESRDKVQEDIDSELVTPYCGGCGHRYFHAKKIPYKEAKEQAKTKRCNYCLEDMAAEEREAEANYQPRLDSPPSIYLFDSEY